MGDEVVGRNNDLPSFPRLSSGHGEMLWAQTATMDTKKLMQDAVQQTFWAFSCLSVESMHVWNMHILSI